MASRYAAKPPGPVETVVLNVRVANRVLSKHFGTSLALNDAAKSREVWPPVEDEGLPGRADECRRPVNCFYRRMAAMLQDVGVNPSEVIGFWVPMVDNAYHIFHTKKLVERMLLENPEDRIALPHSLLVHVYLLFKPPQSALDKMRYFIKGYATITDEEYNELVADGVVFYPTKNKRERQKYTPPYAPVMQNK